MASPDGTHMQNHVKNNNCFSTATCHQINTRKIFYKAYIKHCIDYASVAWDGCGEVHFKKKKKRKRKQELPTLKGRHINPS